MIRKIKKLRKELEETEKAVTHNKFMLNMMKVSCCDFCMTDGLHYRHGINCDADVFKPEHKPILQIDMGFRSFNVCRKHAKLLSEFLADQLSGGINEENYHQYFDWIKYENDN